MTPKRSRPVSPRRALLVDDEECTLGIERLYLDKMGFEVHVARTGEEALLFLQSSDVDLVVADTLVGRVDGVAVHSWLATNRPDLAARFLLMSGDLAGLHDGRVLPLHRLQKPFRFGEYLLAVAETMNARTTVPAMQPATAGAVSRSLLDTKDRVGVC
jgi:DNA-binding response OmpR family regulator